MINNGFKRSLPRPTVAIRLDAEAGEEDFPQAARDACAAVKAMAERNPESTSVTVHRINGAESAPDGEYAVLDASVTDEQITGILRRLCARNVKSPFEKRSVVHAYHMDATSYVVENRLNTGEIKIRCWDEACCEIDARPGVAVSADRTHPVRPHMFTSRSDLHHAARFERLHVDMTSGVCVELDVGEGVNQARMVYKRAQYAFPYRAVCRALACLMEE